MTAHAIIILGYLLWFCGLVWPASSRAQPEALSVSLRAGQSQYRVGEPVELYYRANQPSYVYVFNEDQDGVTQLLPSPSQPLVRQAAQQEVALLRGEVRGDRAGDERLIVVASRVPLPWNASGFSPGGTAGARNRADFWRQLSALEQRAGDGVRVLRLTLAIGASNPSNPSNPSLLAAIRSQWNSLAAVGSAAGAPAPALPLAFIATDRRAYRAGDAMLILIGASSDGYVHLFGSEAGAMQALGKRRVQAGVLHTLRTRAMGGPGRQQLAVLWSADGTLDEARVVAQLQRTQNRAVRVVAAGDEALPFNACDIEIQPASPSP